MQLRFVTLCHVTLRYVALRYVATSLQADGFLALSILKDLEQGEVGCVATWDSSAHNSVYLNRVTQEQERLFLTVRVTVRIRDRVGMKLFLAKIITSLNLGVF